MSLKQEDEAKEQQRQIQAEIDRIDATNAENAPLIALQRENALAQEGKIKLAREGGIVVDDSTLRDFREAEEALNERFRKAGTFGSTEHANALNDFHTKKAESIAAIREGRLTNLQQRATASNERLSSNLTAGRNSSRTISDLLSANRPQRGFSRSTLAKQFQEGVTGTIGQAVRQPIQNVLSSGVNKGVSKLQQLFSGGTSRRTGRNVASAASRIFTGARAPRGRRII